MPNVVNSDQYQVVQDLLERQDKALEQLNALNERVEAAIETVNAFRNVDEEDRYGELAESTTVESPQEAVVDAPVVKKAA